MYCMKLLETKGVQRKENCTLSLLLAKYSVGFSDFTWSLLAASLRCWPSPAQMKSLGRGSKPNFFYS